VNYQAGAV